MNNKFLFFLSILANLSLLNSAPDQENLFKDEDDEVASYFSDNPKFEDSFMRDLERYKAAKCLGLFYLESKQPNSAYEWFSKSGPFRLEGIRSLGLYYEKLANGKNQQLLRKSLNLFQQCVAEGHKEAKEDYGRIQTIFVELLLE